MLSIGDSKVSKLYLGDTEFKKAYLGDALVLDNSIKFYTVSATISPSGTGTITGTGTYADGTQVTLIATPSDGYEFTGWTENGVTVSTSTSYTFTVNKDRTLTAVCEEPLKELTWNYTSTFSAQTNGYYFWDITYGDDKFVVVGGIKNSGGERCQMYSTDGINFTRRTSGDYAILQSVAYGASLFVAVGFKATTGSNSPAINANSDIVSYNWGSPTVPSGLGSGVLRGLAYGNNRFVAFKTSGNQFIYSSDGSTWTRSTLPTSASWTKIAYGANKFVAVSNGNISLYSNDGLNWDTSTLPSSKNWYSITYGANKFVTLANNSDQAAYSNDGITWNSVTLPETGNWIDVAYGAGMFVAVPYNGDTYIYSRDGLKWKTGKLQILYPWQAIAYGGGKFVALAYGKNKGIYAIV